MNTHTFNKNNYLESYIEVYLHGILIYKAKKTFGIESPDINFVRQLGARNYMSLAGGLPLSKCKLVTPNSFLKPNTQK